jgi:UDP-N-acetylglucosamine--N-acetylmuramyl-(pentapeptide) pyrophosphoryl-undecaprenol N-acetylglucosamine transferase
MRLLIAGGGTGGHIYPALAVASSLRARLGTAELDWVGGHRGIEDRIVPAAGFRLRRLALRSLRTVDLNAHVVLDPLRLALSVPQAFAILLARRPAAVFTTGGYVAIPMLLAARALRIPALLWEGNAIPGRSVRATAGWASVVAVTFGETCRALDAASRCYETGTPIRETRTVDRLAARETLGIPPGGRLLLVFGGSQAVRRLNRAVVEALPTLVDRWFVAHVTGDDGLAEAMLARAALPEVVQGRYRPEPFLAEGMLTALAAADAVVGRAGSSTVAEVTALGLPMIVVPYPHAGGHQRRNAEILAAAGAAELIDDADFDAAALLEAVARLEDPGRHAQMAAAARGLARPAAADAVADLLIALAERRPLPDASAVDRLSRGTAGAAP